MIAEGIFALLIVGSIVFLKSLLDARVEEQTMQEDLVFAEITLPLSRVISLLSDEEIDRFDDELLDALNIGFDQVIILVRKYAWRLGIKVCPKETAVMYKHIRGEGMTPEEFALFESIKDDASQVMIFPGGLVIVKDKCDN